MLPDLLYHDLMKLPQKFTEHPESVDETYTEHMAFAFSMSGRLMKAAWCCAIHAVMPWRHCTTGSTAIKDLYEVVTAGARADLEEAA